MDKVQKIREEVERLKLCTMDEHMKFYSECAEAEYNALCKVEKIIDSLQEESVSKDLEEAAEDYGIRQGAELKPFAIKFFKAGAKWKEEQMIKNAVETSVCALLDGLHVIIKPEYLKEYRFGEKVKVKIFKEK